MILFFGTREVKQDDPQHVSQGGHCPSCGNHVSLQPRVGRNYFHIFWIPLIPLGESTHYLQCPVCKARYVHRNASNQINRS